MESVSEKSLFQSRFLLTFERDGLVALVHQLHPEPVYSSKRLWQSIIANPQAQMRLNQSVVSELVARDLLIADTAIDRQSIEIAKRETLQSLNRATILYLMMAQHCNFACSYCPIPGLAKRHGDRLLSFDDAVAGIRLWQYHIGENPVDDNPYFLIFYGGEALLNQGVLEKLLPYIAKEKTEGRLPEKLELMLCTNGSLVNEQLSKLFAVHKVMVAVGIDGPQEHNDRIRLTSDRGPTFLTIKDAIKQLTDNGVKVVASATITPKNVHQLAEYPDFMRKLGITQFGFNLMKGTALVHELGGKSAEEYCEAAARSILTGLADADENGSCYEYQLGKRLGSLKSGLPFSVDCTCYGNQLVIQADGQVSNCPFLRCDQGHVKSLPDTFRIGETQTVKEWRHRLPLLNDSLMANSDAMLDGGGCAWSSSELYGNVTSRDNHNAIFTKEVMRELIWVLLPREQSDALRREEATHWSHRRIGDL